MKRFVDAKTRLWWVERRRRRPHEHLSLRYQLLYRRTIARVRGMREIDQSLKVSLASPTKKDTRRLVGR